MRDTRTKGYKKAFKKYGVDPRALQWVSEEAAKVRHRQLVADLDFEGKIVLDVGCGFADIIPFISQKAKKLKYTGG